jgi:hypothetical protein
MADLTLDDVFAGKAYEDEPATEQPVAEPTAEPEAKAEPEQGAKAQAEPEAKAPTAGADDDNKEWTKAMALDERRKRQELERKLKEYESLSAKKAEPKIDLFENPDGAMESVLNKARHEVTMAKLEMSQELMKSLHDDYEELEMEFIDLAGSNPAVLADFQKAANPARFAYETAKKAREAEQLKDVDSYKDKLRAEVEAEIRAKLEAEMTAKSDSDAKRDKALTPSLAKARSAGGLDDHVAPSLDDILKRKR